MTFAKRPTMGWRTLRAGTMAVVCGVTVHCASATKEAQKIVCSEIEKMPAEKIKALVNTAIQDLDRLGYKVTPDIWTKPGGIQEWVNKITHQIGCDELGASSAGLLAESEEALSTDAWYCGPPGYSKRNVARCLNTACERHDSCYARCSKITSGLCKWNDITAPCDEAFWANVDSPDCHFEYGTRLNSWAVYGLAAAINVAGKAVPPIGCGTGMKCPRGDTEGFGVCSTTDPAGVACQKCLDAEDPGRKCLKEQCQSGGDPCVDDTCVGGQSETICYTATCSVPGPKYPGDVGKCYGYTDASTCDHVAKCAGKACGDDGCGTGATCGTCKAGETCVAGKCAATCDHAANCAGKTCGDDGCGTGATCGACSSSETCTGGKCVPGTCFPIGTTCTAASDCCSTGTGIGPLGSVCAGTGTTFICRSRCRFGSECSDGCCSGIGAAEKSGACFVASICSSRGVGDACTTGKACNSGLSCAGVDSFCAKSCTSNADCAGVYVGGINMYGRSNWCTKMAVGAQCFPSCASDADCWPYAGMKCQAAFDWTGASIKVCAK